MGGVKEKGGFLDSSEQKSSLLPFTHKETLQSIDIRFENKVAVSKRRIRVYLSASDCRSHESFECSSANSRISNKSSNL